MFAIYTSRVEQKKRFDQRLEAVYIIIINCDLRGDQQTS